MFSHKNSLMITTIIIHHHSYIHIYIPLIQELPPSASPAPHIHELQELYSGDQSQHEPDGPVVVVTTRVKICRGDDIDGAYRVRVHLCRCTVHLCAIIRFSFVIFSKTLPPSKNGVTGFESKRNVT